MPSSVNAPPPSCWRPPRRAAHHGCPRVTDKTSGRLLSLRGSQRLRRPAGLRRIAITMAQSSGNAFFANFGTYDAPLPTKVRVALANSLRKVRTRSGYCGTTVSRAADSRPRGLVRVPTTTDTRTTTTASDNSAASWSAGKRAAITARAAWRGEDAVKGATADQLAMGAEHLDGLLIQGDRADPRLGLGSLLHAAARPVRVAERPRDPHPPRPADRTVVQRRVQPQIIPPKGGQLPPAHPCQPGDQHQRPVAWLDRLGQPVELGAGQPHLAPSHGLIAGRAGPARSAFSQQRRAGQVVVVDGGVEDRPEQRQVGVDGAGRQLLGDHRGFPGADRGGVQVADRDVPEDGQDALFDLLAGAVLGAWVLVLPCWPPLGGHVLPEGRVRLLRVRVGHRLGLAAVAALDRALLGQRTPLGGEDAGRTLPLAVLVAHLVALVGIASRRRDRRDPGHVGCLRVAGLLVSCDPRS